jgi:hypothetical protein
MPIENPTPQTVPVFFPEENYTIVKYIDLAKFLSLLQTESLFFCRLDKMEDKFEGTSAKLSIKENEEWYRDLYEYGHLKSENIDESVAKDLAVRQEMEEKFKKLVCISCWNKNIAESYALWKIYSDIDKGIMITSNVKKLINSLAETPENISLSEIKYIDHNKDYFENSNMTFPIIHKHLAYSYEQEIRLIYQLETENGFIYDWKENENGKYLKVNLEILIDEIILSPYSPQWFFNIIHDLLKKYNLNKKIRYSELK